MKTESTWKYDNEKKVFTCGAMSAEIDENGLVSMYVMNKKFLEFGDSIKVMEFSLLLKLLSEKIS